MSSNGKAKKFVRLLKDGKLRWASKEQDIIKIEKYIERIVSKFQIQFKKFKEFCSEKGQKHLESNLI